MTIVDDLRCALSFFTVLPVRSSPVDRRTAGRTMMLAPLAGALVGLGAATVVIALRTLIDIDEPYEVLIAVAGIATLTAGSRALHLDGLADTADALGSYRPPAEAAEIMARGDIGPFGITALVLTLLLQVGGLLGCLLAHQATQGLVLAAIAGGLSATLGCVGIPSARDEGLGALMARSVSRAQAAGAAAACVAVAAVAGSIDEASGVLGSIRGVAALGIGVGAAWLFRRHAVRRLGGIGGDVFGAVIEVAITATLLAVAIIR